MPLSNSDKLTLVMDALKKHLAFDIKEGEEDTRTLDELKAAFLKMHLNDIVGSYQSNQAKINAIASIEVFDSTLVS